MYHTSLYRRLTGTHIHAVGRAIHNQLTSNLKEGTALLKIIYGQLYSGKLAHRCGYAPTDECPLYHKPYSCTSITGECPDREAHRLSRHIAACQLIHAAIRKTAKGGEALHTAPDLVLLAADTGSHPQTTDETLALLSTTPKTPSPSQEEGDPTTREDNPPLEWLAPLPTTEDIRRKRHTDVSQDPEYSLRGLSAADGDAKCTTAPRGIPRWVLPIEESKELFLDGHGTASDLIYARGGPRFPLSRPDLLQQERLHP
jgi:hypothetical protein